MGNLFIPILFYKYQFYTYWGYSMYNVHMLCLVTNSTSLYYHDLLSPLLLLSPIIIPHCWLTQFPNPMGSRFKIVSNLGRLSISLNIATMWGNIVVNNAKTTSSFKHDSSVVKHDSSVVSVLKNLFFQTNQVDWMGLFD